MLMSFKNWLKIIFSLKIGLWGPEIRLWENLKWHIRRVKYLPAPAEHSAHLCCYEIMENKFWQRFSRSFKWFLCQGRWAGLKSSQCWLLICVSWDPWYHKLVSHFTPVLPFPAAVERAQKWEPSQHLISLVLFFIRMRAAYWSVFVMLRFTLFSQLYSECSVKRFLNTNFGSIWKYM